MVSQLVASFAATIPAGTLQSAPATVALNIPSRLVNKIRIRVPSGPRGNVGFQIAAQGQQIIPETLGAFLVADDEIFTWDLVNFPEGGAYQLIGYNTGQFAHTVYVTFELDPLTPAPTPPPAIVPAAAVSTPPPLPSQTVASGTQTTSGAPTMQPVTVGASVPPALPTVAPVAIPTVASPTLPGAPEVTPPVLPPPPTV